MSAPQYARYHSASSGQTSTKASGSDAKHIEDILLEDSSSALYEKCDSCVEPIEVTGPSNPTTYIYVNADGIVEQKLTRATNRIFSRFMPREHKPEPEVIEVQAPVETPQPGPKTSLFEMLSTELVTKKAPTAEEIDKIVQERVEKALREKIANEMKVTPTQKAVEDYTPFFNNELYATYDCTTNLNDHHLKLKVELAGLLTSSAVLYPFGNKPFQSREYPLQKMDFHWYSDTQKGMCRCHLDFKDDKYIILFDRIVTETGKDDLSYEEIKFEDITLPAIFTYEGKLSRA